MVGSVPFPQRMNVPVSGAGDVDEVLREIRDLGGAQCLPVAPVSLARFVSALGMVANWEAFETLLGGYAAEVIVGRDWPVMLKSWELARRGEARELIALDRSWSPGEAPTPAEASWRVGRRQLSRMRPLSDQRVVQRYLAAVETDRARGWHPLVYGVVLAVYGIPLRQGLMHYAVHSASGWCDALVRQREWVREGGELAVERVCASLPARMPALPNGSLFTP